MVTVLLAAPAAATDQGQVIVNAAASQSNVAYCGAGGNTSGPTHGTGGPGCSGATVGFDCSGLALYAVYQATGITLPHGHGMESAPGGTQVSEADLKPGDLVFFGGGSLSNFVHVGIYAGNGMMWDANDYNVPVQQHSLAWEEHGLAFVGGVRYWNSGSPAPSISSGSWYLRNSNSGGSQDISRQFGIAGDIPLTGDWNHDGVLTVGVYRPSDHAFYLSNSTSSQYADIVTQFGATGDIPVVGDWDFEGTTTIGVYRPSESKFYLSNSNVTGASDYVFQYGAAGDKPVAGDWNGDGFVTVGVFRPSNATWYLRNSNSAGAADTAVAFGAATDMPVTGNWDGVGGTTIGVWRPSNRNFYLSNSNSSGFSDYIFEYGAAGDVPVTGDWDHNGTTTIGVAR